MNEQQRMLADTVERLFPAIAAEQRGHGARGTSRVRGSGCANALGIADVLVPEEAGGFGGNWQDAAVVMCTPADGTRCRCRWERRWWRASCFAALTLLRLPGPQSAWQRAPRQPSRRAA